MMDDMLQLPESYIYKQKDEAGMTFYENFEEWFTAYVNVTEAGEQTIKYDKYHDPDSLCSHCELFYKNLTNFLNARENAPEMKDQLVGQYFYSYHEQDPYGIAVFEVTSEGIGEKPVFYLKSDQLGFSSLSAKQNHPYDTYLQDCTCANYLENVSTNLDNKDKVSVDPYREVAAWLYHARSLGGSFLWPMEFSYGKWQENPAYNGARGGTSSYYPRFYIEDRADLTLLEIKEVLTAMRQQDLSGNILWRNAIANTNMVKWLMHFKSFESYVAYFCFEPFVNLDTYLPYDITTDGQDLDPKDGRVRKIYYDEEAHMSPKDMKNMFDQLIAAISARTKSMEDYVRQ